jgi:hypothetical protein
LSIVAKQKVLLFTVNNYVIVKRKKKRKVSSGHGPQREARYQDELVD